MIDPSKRLRMMVMTTLGEMPLDQYGAITSVLGGAPLLQETPSALGVAKIHNVTDVNGDLLIAGNIYWLRGKKVRVLRERFGAGNALNCYYRVFYIDDSLEERHLCVDARYPNGVFAPPSFQSCLAPEEDHG